MLNSKVEVLIITITINLMAMFIQLDVYSYSAFRVYLLCLPHLGTQA